ncbi:P1 family peptidase [Archangium primigenium]|uniref:DmpA family aminopeptidase n=1 Tax=[Archangium] primigenium TaxID=2792470 RepID=UPI00195E6D86|nr:P1 family peptidase [Archangium primigenium]MBM7117197.1 P1 family peptidase [Archangium primigenium]
MANPPETESPEKRVRARDLGLSLGRFKPGKHNAITDVEGVLVGHSTIIQGEGALTPGKGPVRTGVTAILPNRRDIFMERMTGGGFVLNGAGEVSGMTQLMEWGLVETPILLTNTMAVGAVSDAVARYMVEQNPGIGDEHDVIIPIVGECDDSFLNDISGRHVKREHVYEAIRSASEGPVAEGNVGGGTGMLTCDFKGGIGTASRKLPEALGGYTLGVLVMSNFGRMHNLRVGGLPVGEVLAEKFKHVPRRTQSYGSIIAVVATDAPLLNHQLNRLCKRVGLGIGRVGSYAAHGSGEIVVGFSTANIIPRRTQKMVYKLKILLDQRLDPLYEAVMEATEEAILNAICMATSMTGVNGNFVPALPLEEIRRFVTASRPLFTPARKRSGEGGTPTPTPGPASGAAPGSPPGAPPGPKVRLSESSFPQPTRPAPDDSEDSSSGGTSGT